MKHLPLFPPRHRMAVLAAAFGLAVLAAPAAHAFTMDNQNNTNSDGTARYTDPDQQFSGSGSGNGQTTIREGNTSLRFGGQQGSFDQRYDSNRVFDALTRPGPSGGR
jgi:hypothetical protein